MGSSTKTKGPVTQSTVSIMDSITVVNIMDAKVKVNIILTQFIQDKSIMSITATMAIMVITVTTVITTDITVEVDVSSRVSSCSEASWLSAVVAKCARRRPAAT